MISTKLYLKRGKEESLRRRHLWVFSGAVARVVSEAPLREGDLVDVHTDEGAFIARGHYAGGSIAVRVLTFRDEPIDDTWWRNRLSAAFDLRRTLGLVGSDRTNCYRLVHGEGDSLSGLVIDVYGQTAILQCHSVGMYRARRQIAAALVEVSGGQIVAVYDKSSGTLPFKGGASPDDGYLIGTGEGAGEVVENGLRFRVDWVSGQKTGFFLDQRENRALVGRYSAGRRVLNTFCYTGGFSVYAWAGGAEEVVSVDSSERAVRLADANMQLNFGEEVPHMAAAEDAFDFLNEMERDKYDLIVLDPPAFAKHQRVVAQALQGYKKLNAKAIMKIRRGGILFTFSCSQAVSREQFRLAVFSAAAIAGRNVRILHQLSQPADHPINICHPESEYLKGLVLYVE